MAGDAPYLEDGLPLRALDKHFKDKMRIQTLRTHELWSLSDRYTSYPDKMGCCRNVQT